MIVIGQNRETPSGSDHDHEMGGVSAMARVEHLAPSVAALRRAALFLAAVLPLALLAGFLGGGPAIVWAVLGLIVGVTCRAFLDTGRSVGLGVAAAATVAVAGATAAATSGDDRALAIGVIVAGAAVLAGLADLCSAGVLTLVPALAAIVGTDKPGLNWQTTSGWVLAGALYGIIALALLHVHVPPQPIDGRRVALHAAVMAALCGIGVGLIVAFRLPHGYWLILTFAVVLRPVVQESQKRAVQRVAGTVLGVLIPIPVVYFLPHAAVAPIGIVCLFGCVAYLFAGDYVRQSIFLTMTVVILASGGIRAEVLELGELRAIWTLIGAAVAAGAAALLWHIERDWPAPPT
jgi:MFS family permease